MKVNVLTYAESFQSFEFNDFLKVIAKGEQFAEETLAPLNQPSDLKGTKSHQNTIKAPVGFKSAWQKLKKQNWGKICAPSNYGGQGFPESVGIAVLDAFSAANPAFYYYLMQTIEVAKLIDQYGRSGQKEPFCQKLFDCEWSGCFGLEEGRPDFDRNSIQTIATSRDDYYLISGTKPSVIAPHHDLTDNYIHLVLARIPGVKQQNDRTGLFIVPFFRPQENKLIENNIHITHIHKPSGIKGAPSCSVSYGHDGPCHGYLIEGIDQNMSAILNSLDSFRLQVALQGAATSNSICSYAIDIVKNSAPNNKKGSAESSSAIQSPQIADALIRLKSISEGIRGAVYMTAFFNDCLLQGAEQQKDFFSDLIHLYSRLMKVYATDSGLEVINQGLRIIGDIRSADISFVDQSYRDLRAGSVIGSLNDVISEEFLNDVLLVDDGRTVSHLIKQFESVEVHLARTESLRETITVWQDYIGGIIVLLDDLKKLSETGNRNQLLLFARKVLRYFGDVILCYHLIDQGLAAEKILEEAGLNFYNLKDEVVHKPEYRKWYNKLIQAEYFALNILALQEATLHILQRNPSSALDIVLELD